MSTADSLQLISIVIAINALISGLFLWGVNKDRKDIKKNMKDIEDHSKYLDMIILELIEWMISKESFDKNERGMLRRFLKTKGQAKELERFDETTNTKREEYKRQLQHLMLFSTDATRNTSAHKQLVNAYGNTSTINLLHELKTLRSNDPAIEYSLKELKARIDDQLKNK